MLKNLFQEGNNSFKIPVIIFLLSSLILFFNLNGQGPHQDELDFFYAYAIVYFNLVKQGDFFDPCWNGNGECQLLPITGCNMDDHWVTTSGAIKHILIGIASYLGGEKDWNSYAPSPPLCKPSHNPIPGKNIPLHSELTNARFFSPLLGAFTIVLSYLIGKLLFNKFIGITFSLLLLFNSLWIVYSRTLMNEVYSLFFAILAIFLMLRYVSCNHNSAIKYLILSAIVFAVALNTKYLTLEFLPFLLLLIFFKNRNFKDSKWYILKDKKILFKSFVVILFFVAMLIPSVFITHPFYWIGPIEQLQLQKESLKSYETEMSLHLPWNLDQKPHVRIFGTIHTTLMPIIDIYYYNFDPDNIPVSAKTAYTYSSIPLTIFLLAGIGYIFYNIKKHTLSFSEFLILFWYISFFVITSMITESYNTSRFFVPLFIPMALVSSFGFWKFIKDFDNIKLQIILFSIFILTHISTALYHWHRIYFEPFFMWGDPLRTSFQEAMTSPYVLVLGISFLIFITYCTVIKLKINRQIN